MRFVEENGDITYEQLKIVAENKRDKNYNLRELKDKVVDLYKGVLKDSNFVDWETCAMGFLSH